MKKNYRFLSFIPVLLGLVAYTVYRKEWVITALIGLSGISMLYVFIIASKKKKSVSVPIYDSLFAGGFVLMMIALRWQIKDTTIFLFMFVASLLMGIPVFILLWKTFPAKNLNEENNGLKGENR